MGLNVARLSSEGWKWRRTRSRNVQTIQHYIIFHHDIAATKRCFRQLSHASFQKLKFLLILGIQQFWIQGSYTSLSLIIKQINMCP